ncbi:MAG TPA: type II secretion system protein [Humisphaera sp.]
MPYPCRSLSASVRRGVVRGDSRAAFTLVELLVVIGIIALLMSILLPTLGRVREQAAAVSCASNMRQWGVAFHVYADANQGRLPIDGNDGTAAAPIGRWDDQGLWVNALPPLVGSRPYGELTDPATGTGNPPGPNEKSLFGCPAVDTVAGQSSDTIVGGQYFQLTGQSPTGAASVRPTFLCYVFNSKLLSSAAPVLKLTQLRDSTSWVLMVEKRMVPGELPTTDANYSATLARAKADRKRLANRHQNKKGGYLLFADGHVAFCDNREANTPNPSASGTDYNYPGVRMWAYGRAAD